MKKASQILYTVGKVFNASELIGFAIMLIVGILAAAFPGAEMIPMLTQRINAAVDATGIVRGTGVGMIVGGAIGVIVSAVVLYLASRATKSLENNVTENTPHVVMIVVGFFGVVFYMIGGIIGIIAENSENHVGA